MRKAFETTEIIGMWVCIGYTTICWLADFMNAGNMHPGARYYILAPAGSVTTTVGLVLALTGYRRRPMLARFTFAACFLWVLWSFMPRL